MILTTPGVYFEHVDRSRPAISTLRTDIAGFVGYAERGPLLSPIRLTSWRQFQAAFGQPLSLAFLGETVHGFFENGGAVCYAVRVADSSKAQAAFVNIPGEDGAPALLLNAAYGAFLDSQGDQLAAPPSSSVSRSSPGAWGNRLAVALLPGSVASAEASLPQPIDGQTTQVDNLSGLAVGSVVRFVQNGSVMPAHRMIQSITAYLRQIEWDEPLTGLGLDFTRPFRIEGVEFTLQVLLDRQIVEQHEHLTLSPAHKSSYVVDVLRQNSNYLEVTILGDETTLTRPERWPVPTDVTSLSHGLDGLVSVSKNDFRDAIDALAKVDEVSLLAAPDVVLQAELPTSGAARGRGPDCDSLDPLPEGRIVGSVVTITEDGSEKPVAGVTVTPLGVAGFSVTSATNGSFTLVGLPEGQISLRMERPGFHMLETTVQARIASTQVEVFTLIQITTPPAFSGDDIAELQELMIRQGEQGLYRVALLDPPGDQLKLDAIQTWCSRFDSAFGAIYYPWLIISSTGSTGELRQLPPSGHVAGLIARTDLSQGVHRAPANYELEGVKALSHPVNDVEHGLLNTLGINCLRALPGRGIRIAGARTLSSDSEWRYLNVRRLVLMIEEAVEEANQWAVFEPNNPLLRQLLSYSLNSFLNTLWRQGALAGATPEAAYQVKCDIENNPPSVTDVGQIIAEIFVAPTIPFEFIRFRLGRTVEAVAIRE